MRQATNVLLVGVLVAGLLSQAAHATITLEADWEEEGMPITLSEDAILGAPPDITLRTNLHAPLGADITVMAPINDDPVNPTHLYFDAGTAGTVYVGSAIGELVPVAGVDILAAGRVDLAGVRTQGPGGITAGNAPAGTTLNGNLATQGGAITMQGNIVLGLPAAITLDSSGGGGGGGAITFSGAVSDDTLSATTLILKAGTGNVTLQGAVGGPIAPFGLTVVSANQVSLAAVTSAGPITVAATKLTVNGAMASGGMAVALNAPTIDLKAVIQTGGGALTGTASTVNLSSGGSLQNAVDVAAPGATLHVAGATYNESVTVATALTMDLLDTTTIGQSLAIQNNVGLSGLAAYLAVGALAISGEAMLDVGSIPVRVDGDVEFTLDEWIGDGRLLSSAWGASLNAVYDPVGDWTCVSPEPASATILIAGLAGLFLRRRLR
ncbi:MAG: hypothetical protein NTX87_05870 [Planctomycetota bacterium]|nr:hypothetical protein [Planctomycetota bacterium]